MWYLIFILFLLLVIYGVCVIVRDMNRFVIRRYEVRSEKIKKKYTIVMLSDLHNKSYGKNNEKLVRAIRECRPDCVMTAGDLYTSKAGSGFDNAAALLRALSEQFPVYISNGNHENKTRLDTDTFGTMYADYEAELQKYGLQTLVNEHVMIPEANLDVCGLTIGQEYFRHFKKKKMPDGYLRSLAGCANGNRFQILLAHNPLYFPEYVSWGADLVLSGHIHGGIVKLPVLGGVVSPAVTLFPEYDGGRFELGGGVMILGRGLGTHTLPVRMWNPGEVVVVTLLPEA